MIKKTIVIVLPIAAILIFALWYFSSEKEVATGNNNPQMETYTDLAGRNVTIKKEVRRIILLRSKDIYSLAVLLGDELPQRLIAWGPDLKNDDTEAYDKFTSRFPTLKELPLTGSIYSDALSVEQLLQLQPDLVIADKFIIDRGYRYREKMEEAGLPVIYLDGSTDPLTGPQQGIALLGKILGKEKRAKAEEIVKYVNSQLNTVLTVIDQKSPVSPSVYLEAGLGGPEKQGQTYGSSGLPKKYTSWGAVLNRLKVNNIADGIASSMERINPEFILKSDPGVIIITGQNWNTSAHAMRLGYYARPEEARALLKGFTTRSGWDSLSAVKNNRVYSIFHNSAAVTCFASIQALAKYVYPDHFKELHPEDNLRDFYRKFMPLEYSGVWMTGIH